MLEALLLGSAQDAGLPQAGCYCRNCLDARSGVIPSQYAVSLALIDHAAQTSWLIDATPDLREQLHLLHQHAPNYPLAGIFLTHAHIGHYIGLIHLGREAMNTQALPVFATSSLGDFLRNNGPWSQLLRLGNIDLRPLSADVPVQVGGWQVTALPVPHRNEYSDTVAFVVEGEQKRLFYCPDIDRWEGSERDVRSVVANVDLALLDASFFSADELPGRNLGEIPHPLVTDTLSRLEGVSCEVCLIHRNHSNPLNREGAERLIVEKAGFTVGWQGMRWEL